MSFLESIQHGLEKASKEAARITKIHHLQNVANDLSFKSAQEGQNLIARALEMHRNGQLPPELAAICQQIITYQQQINEVQAEIQKLHEEQEEQPVPPAPPTPGGYTAYPSAPPAAPAPGYTPQPYPPYPTQAAGYAGYQAAPPPYQGYGTQTPPSSEVPTKPGGATSVVTQAPPPSSEVPTKPGTAPKAHHKSKEAPKEDTNGTSENRSSYEEGALPTVYSPFAKPAATTEDGEKKTNK